MSDEQPRKPTPFEVEQVLLRLGQTRKEEKVGEVTRFRVSEATLKRICGRRRPTTEFLVELQDLLLDKGWALFFVGDSYAMLKLDVVKKWIRLGRKRIENELNAIERCDFKALALLLQSDAPTKDRSVAMAATPSEQDD